VREYRHLEWERGRLLAELFDSSGQRALGYSRLDVYAARELGLSPKETLGTLALWRRSQAMPEAHAAWKQGRVGPMHVHLLLEVALPGTQAAWLERASSTSWKRFEAEARAMAYQRDTLGHAAWMAKTAGLPPIDTPGSELRADFEKVFAEDGPVVAKLEGACAAREASATETTAVASPEGACALETTPPGPEPTDFVTLTVWVEPDVATMVRAALRKLRERMGEHLTDGECLHFMLLMVSRAHVWGLPQHDTLTWRVYQRDGWLCQSPGCRSIGPLHAHHIWWRSAGGPDEPWNLISLCEPCHRMVHAKAMVIVLGRGPEDHVFLFGLLPNGRCREAYRNGARIPTEQYDWRQAWAHLQRLQAA